jgi:hypothetical protein
MKEGLVRDKLSPERQMAFIIMPYTQVVTEKLGLQKEDMG